MSGLEHADLIAIRQIHADLPEPQRVGAHETEIGFRIIEAEKEVTLIGRDAVVIGVFVAHAEQRLDDSSHANEGARAARGVHVAGVAVTRALRRFGGVVHQQNSAVGRAGDLAIHCRDHFDLLVGVFVHLMGFDEGVDDKDADLIIADLCDASIEVGKTNDHSALVGAGEKQRPVGARVERYSVADLREGDRPVL